MREKVGMLGLGGLCEVESAGRRTIALRTRLEEKRRVHLIALVHFIADRSMQIFKRGLNDDRV